jgi:hypothetical protein
MKLTTAGLILRPWTLEDLPAFEQVTNDQTIENFTSSIAIWKGLWCI